MRPLHISGGGIYAALENYAHPQTQGRHSCRPGCVHRLNQGRINAPPTYLGGGIYAALENYAHPQTQGRHSCRPGCVHRLNQGRINAPPTYRQGGIYAAPAKLCASSNAGAAFMPPWLRASSEPGAH